DPCERSAVQEARGRRWGGWSGWQSKTSSSVILPGGGAAELWRSHEWSISTKRSASGKRGEGTDSKGCGFDDGERRLVESICNGGTAFMHDLGPGHCCLRAAFRRGQAGFLRDER